jgi:hypothetical protein
VPGDEQQEEDDDGGWDGDGEGERCGERSGHWAGGRVVCRFVRWVCDVRCHRTLCERGNPRGWDLGSAACGESGDGMERASSAGWRIWMARSIKPGKARR